MPSVQNGLLLLAGMGWLYHLNPIFAAIIACYSSCMHLLGLLMSSENENVRKFWLGFGVATALAVLCFFKYFDFFRPFIRQYTGQSEIVDILMPLGLSYYTFQSLAYLVYCCRHPMGDRFAWHELLLHLSFFPTITSGPIIRAAAFKSIDGEQAGALEQIRTAEPRALVRPALAVCLTDLDPVSPLFEGAKRSGILSGEELLSVRALMSAAKRVREELSAALEDFPVLEALRGKLRDFSPELDALAVVEDSGRLVDGASPKLRTIRTTRSEERRVGKECRSRWSPYR